MGQEGLCEQERRAGALHSVVQQSAKNQTFPFFLFLIIFFFLQDVYCHLLTRFSHCKDNCKLDSQVLGWLRVPVSSSFQIN